MIITQPQDNSTTRLAALPVLAEHIPDDLKARKQWVCWRYVETPGKEKPDKRPYHPSGYAASTDKSATWTTFPAALDGYQQAAFDGIGYVLSPDDPYVGIDLDRCVTDGVPEPWAEQTIAALDTYTETSPSGTGVRLLLRGKLPASSGNRKDGIEAYDSGRFLTITGHVLRDSPIQARQEALEAFCRHHLPAAVPVGPGSYSFTPSPPLADAEVFTKLGKAKNADKARRLWQGDCSDYNNDDSRADAGLIAMLAFFTQDEGQIDRLVSQSKLGERPKWRNREDYRQRTIRRVLAGLETTWQPAPEAPVEIPSDEWFAGLRAGGGREEMFASGEISTVFGPSAALIQEVVSLDAPWEALDEPVTSAESAQPEPEDRDYYKHNELHDAETVMVRLAATLRYCKALGGWLVYESGVWRKDEAAAQRAVIGAMKALVCDGIQAGDKEVISNASRRLSKHHLDAVFALARTVAGVGASSGQFDAQPWLLNFANGTLELDSGTFREHRPGDYLTKVLAYKYDPQATCPRWERFLREITRDDANLVGFLQRAIGYSLTGTIQEHALFVLWGSGRNGKGVFTETVRKLLACYAENLEVRSLMKTSQRGMPNDIARLKGARFVTASESEQRQELDAARVKALTGGDTLTGEYKYGEQFDFAPSHKLWLSTNYRPAVTDHTASIWDRMKLIPFTVHYRNASEPGDDPLADTALPAKLEAELPGIVNWALAGCRQWQADGLGNAEAIQATTREYRLENDPVEAFIEACCHRQPGAAIAAKVLHAKYSDWSFGQGLTPKGSTEFRDILRDKSIPQKHRNTGLVYVGVVLR